MTARAFMRPRGGPFWSIRVSRLYLPVGFMLALCAGNASAQTSTGGIRGFIKDGTGSVLVGVTVEATSPARIGGAAVDITDAQGLYTFQNLPIGQYTVVYTLQGFSVVHRDGIRVEPGRTIELDVEMQLGTVEQAITVTGESPVVDAQHAGTTTNFSSELLQNLPSLRRAYFDIIHYAPAVQADGAMWVMFGSVNDQNAIQYDGIEVSSPMNGITWDFPSSDLIQEVQVKSVGAEAEYAGFQGGVINIVTKAPTNRLRGMISGYTMPSGLVSNNTPTERFPARVKYFDQMSAEIGGPISRDRLWMYGLFPWSRNLRTNPGVDPELPGVPEKGYKPFVKGTWKPSGADTVDVTYSFDKWQWPAQASRTSPIETQRVEHGIFPKIFASWNRVLASATLFQFKMGRLDILDNRVSFTDDFTTPQRQDVATGLASGNAINATRWDQDRTTIDASLSHNADDLLKGSHGFKAGVQTLLSGQRTYVMTLGGATYFDFRGAPDTADFRDTQVYGSSFPSVGAFVQDTWTVSNRITLNLGVRYDHLDAKIPAMSSQTTIYGRKSGVAALTTPTNVEYPGISDVFTFNHWSPRVGLTVRLDRSGRTIFKTSAGRYYGKVSGDMFNTISPGYAATETRRWNPATGQFDILLARVDPKANVAVDPNLENHYTDQFYIGLERQIMSDTGVDVMFVYKNANDFIRMKDTRGTYAPREIVDTFGGVSQTLTVYDLAVPSSQRLFTVINRPELEQPFKSLILQMTKRLSAGWQAQGSYSWQDSKGYAVGLLGAGASFHGSLAPGGAFTMGQTPNEMINAYGPSPTATDHAFKLSTTYEAPFKVHLGLKYSYEAGRPYARVITVRGLSQGNVTVMAEPRGVYHLPDRRNLSLRINRDIRLPRAHRVRLSADIDNVLNSGAALTVRNNSTQPDFGQTLTVVPSRSVFLGVRYEF